MVMYIISTILLFSIIKQDVGCIRKIEITTGSSEITIKKEGPLEMSIIHQPALATAQGRI